MLLGWILGGASRRQSTAGCCEQFLFIAAAGALHRRHKRVDPEFLQPRSCRGADPAMLDMLRWHGRMSTKPWLAQHENQTKTRA